MRAGLTALALVVGLNGATGPLGHHARAADAAAREAHRFSGAVLVAHHGRVVLLRGYGRSRADALFDIGSVAKTFTAAAVLRLEQDGRLRVGDPISRYLPDVPASRRALTIRQLLTHTAGLPQSFDSDLERVQRDEAVRRILLAPGTRPGRFAYSNAGYTLLAAIVERVSGMPYTVFVRRRLLRPAGLRSTGWFQSAWLHGRRSHGFVHGRDRGEAGSQVPLSWSILGAGGMLSTAADLFRWSAALRTDRVLSARERAAYRRGYARLPGSRGGWAGFGWVVALSPRHTPVILIGGDTDYGFTSDFRRFVGEGTTIVTLSADDRAPAQKVAARIEHAYFAKA